MAESVRKTAPTGGSVNSGKAGRSNHPLWGQAPVLHRHPGSRYLGRAFVEVWEGGITRAATSNSVLLGPALAALQAPHSTVRESDVPLNPATNTSSDSGRAFLGRVVVELWNDRTTVGVTGSDPRLVEHAIKKLTSILTAP